MVYLLILLATVAGVIGVAILAYSDFVGTQNQRARRQGDIIRSFDGRPEVKVRVNGTGWSAEQIAWLGHQYGYSVWRWETHHAAPRCLVLRRSYPALPNAASVGQIRHELRQAPDPATRRRLMMGLLGFGIAAVVEAVRNHLSGDSYVVPTVAVLLFFAGAAALTWHARRADQHRRRTPPPPPSQQKW